MESRTIKFCCYSFADQDGYRSIWVDGWIVMIEAKRAINGSGEVSGVAVE